jgi:ubiquitin C-terminal hydrolase
MDCKMLSRVLIDNAGVIFTKLPQVLQIQLKRFDYDFERDQFVKVNDRHEFGMTLDLDAYIEGNLLTDNRR